LRLTIDIVFKDILVSYAAVTLHKGVFDVERNTQPWFNKFFHEWF